MWNLHTGKSVHSFAGHKSEVTALAFDEAGQLLVSGSHDTDIIVWDLITDSGLFKLRGHKNGITDVKFLKSQEDGARLVVSSSKDFLLKVWDLDTQHCVQTVVGHRAEIWSFDIDPSHSRLVTLSEDTLRFYKIELPTSSSSITDEDGEKKSEASNNMEIDDPKNPKKWQENLIDDSQSRLVFFGSIDRKTKERGSCVRYNSDGSVIAVQSNGKTIEFLRVHSADETKERRKIRFAREKSKAKKLLAQQLKEHAKLLEQLKSHSKTYTETAIPDEPTLQVPEKKKSPSDEVSHAQLMRADAKVQSIAWNANNTKELVISTSANTIEHYRIVVKPKKSEASENEDEDAKEEKDEEVEDVSDLLNTLELPGHRSDVRALALSSNDEMLVSTSNGLIKVWNVRTLSVIRTIQSGYGLCVAYAPGDRHIVVGTKTGKLEFYDLQSARLLESIDAHTAPIWSIQLAPDGTSFVTASADKRLKFWSFDVAEVTQEGNDSDSSDGESEGKGKASKKSLMTSRRLTVSHVKTFDLSDDALACKFSKDGKYLAVSLLDSTVKVFVVDSMKVYHTLYGHKLPVMSLDISDDGQIIVTGSADKNIRIWGMDFGDCHKSIFAHADSVMGLVFVPQTHYFFSVGKDGVLKYWDADKFEHVLSLEGHQAETWALAVSTDGDFVVTGSHDRSLRIWERTDDQVVVTDERETEMEQGWEATMEAEDKYATEEKAESAKATKQTMDTIKSGERLIDALELIVTEEQNWKTYEEDIRKAKQMGQKNPESAITKPPSNELMLGKNPSDFLMHTIKGIRSSDLDEALLLLPLSLVLKLLIFLDTWIKQDLQVELCARCVFFLLRTYQSQISSNKSIQSTIHSIRDNIRAKLTRHKDMIGFNQVALNHIKKAMELESNVKFFEAREDAFKKNGNKRQKVVRKNYWE